MQDKLSYAQLYNELEALNASAYGALLNEDFESFCSAIDGFEQSGVMEQEEFPAAREAYRCSSMPFTLNGIWIGAEPHNPLDTPVADVSGLRIQDLKKRDVYPVYACITQKEAVQPEESTLAAARIEVFEKYKELYQNLYKDNRRTHLPTIPLVANVEKHMMEYISRITELAAVRSRFLLTYDFSCLSVNNKQIIDNEKLKKMPTPEKMKYLTQKFANLYNTPSGRPTAQPVDYFAFNGYKKVLASNYLHGKMIDRKNWKHYTKGILSKLPLFYLELAFYLAIPSSDEIEKFMNLHGYSIKSPMTHFQDISCGRETYHILHRDLCRWIDSGIDYNLINEMCGFQLQQMEVRKPKAK